MKQSMEEVASVLWPVESDAQDAKRIAELVQMELGCNKIRSNMNVMLPLHIRWRM